MSTIWYLYRMDTAPQWLNEREEAAWRSFVRLQAELFARLSRELRHDSDLSESDYPILVALSESPGDRLRFGELGEIVQWEKGRLSKQFARMEQRGLVAREPCLTDGRGAFAVLTPAGRNAIEEAAPRHVEHIRALFIAPLTDGQLDAMLGIANAVLDRLHGDASEPAD